MCLIFVEMKGFTLHYRDEVRPLDPGIKRALYKILSKYFTRDVVTPIVRNWKIREQGGCRIPVHTPMSTLRKEMCRRSGLSSTKVLMTQGGKIIKDEQTCASLGIIEGDVIEVFEEGTF